MGGYGLNISNSAKERKWRATSAPNRISVESSEFSAPVRVVPRLRLFAQVQNLDLIPEEQRVQEQSARATPVTAEVDVVDQ